MSCSVKAECTKAQYGKGIQRSEYQQYINNNKERIEQNKDYYRKRQAIVEHPYGTIKRQWGFDHILTKETMERASADIGFIFTAYNLRRIINIVGIKRFREYLKSIIPYILSLNLLSWMVKRIFSPKSVLKLNFSIKSQFISFLPKLVPKSKMKLAF